MNGFVEYLKEGMFGIRLLPRWLFPLGFAANAVSSAQKRGFSDETVIIVFILNALFATFSFFAFYDVWRKYQLNPSLPSRPSVRIAKAVVYVFLLLFVIGATT